MVTMTSESNSDKASSSLTKKSNVLTAPTASISEVAPNILVYKKVITELLDADKGFNFLNLQMEAIIEKMQGENGGVSVRTVKAFMRLMNSAYNAVLKLMLFLEI